MKKYIFISLLVIFIIPSIALASWWNPFTWKIFSSNKKEIIVTQPQVINTNQVSVITEKTIPVIKTATVNESKKVTPTVNIQKDNKAEIQAKLEANLKAKTDQDVLIAKQKTEEQAKAEAELKAKLIQDSLNKLSISNIVINPTFNSVKISWVTNIISESKVILNGHEYISQGSVGLDHYVNINELNSDSYYTGYVTAISNNAWQNQGFEFRTMVAPPIQPVKSAPLNPSCYVICSINQFGNKVCNGCASA